MLKIFIVDSDPKNILHLEQQLSSCGIPHLLLGKDSNLSHLPKKLEHKDIDVLFLGLDVKEMNCDMVLEILNNRSFEVIILTSCEDLALMSLQSGAFDYLVQPIKRNDLFQCLKKVEILNKYPEVPNVKAETILRPFQQVGKETGSLEIILGEKIENIPINEIIRIESVQRYCNIYLSNGNKILVRKTIKEYENILGNSNFFRINKSHLVNLTHLVKLEKWLDFLIVMSDASVLEVSQNKRSNILKCLGEN